MKATTAPAYLFEVTRSHGDATPAAFFATMGEVACYCQQELQGFINRSDDRAADAAVTAGQRVRFRGPQGLRWVQGLTGEVPAGTAAPRFNPGQPARIFGVERRLYVEARSFAQGTWHYQFQGLAGTYAEALVFGPTAEPTPPATPRQAALTLPEPQPPQLLFSLHSSKLATHEKDGQGQHLWRELPPRLFLEVRPGHPALTRISALCGTTGKLFGTSSYNVGPFRLASGQQFEEMQEIGSYFATQHEGMMPADGAAMLLGTDGQLTEIRPSKGKSFKLPQLCQALGCEWIDVITPQHGPYQGYIMVIDDEGKFKELPINPLATAVWYQIYPLADYSPVDVVAGPVLLMKSKMMR